MNANNNPLDDETLAQYLMGIKVGAKRVPFNPKRDRFNMSYCFETSVHRDLNANRIVIGNSNVAIATQFPFPHQLETQFQMMVDNRTPALVILASDTDMQKNQLPDYFSHSAFFGQLKSTSTFIKDVDLSNDIEAKIYQLEITGYQTPVIVPVIHVHNWPDHQTVSPETTSNLIALIESTIATKRAFYEERGSRAVNDANKMLPVIHCRAGVGRTGQTIAAMAMKRFPELSLMTITKEIRASRNNYMIQTPVQMETLVKLEKMKTKNTDTGLA